MKKDNKKVNENNKKNQKNNNHNKQKKINNNNNKVIEAPKKEEKKVNPPKEVKKVEPPKETPKEPKKEEIKKEETKIEEAKNEEITRESLTVSQIEEMPADPVKPSTMPNSKKSLLKKGNKLLVPCLILFAIILSLFCVIKITSPRYIFKKEIDNIYKRIDDELEEYDRLNKKFDFVHDNIRISTELTMDFPSEDIENLKISSETNFNLKEEFINNNITLTKDNTTVDGRLYYQDDSLYLDSELLNNPIDITDLTNRTSFHPVYDIENTFSEIVDDVIYEPDYYMYDYDLEDLYEFLDKLSTDDARYLLKLIKKEFFKTLEEGQFTKENVKKEINGKTIRLHKITYKIEDKQYRDTLKAIIKAIRNDDKALKILTNITDEDKSDIKEELDDILEEIKDLKFNEEILINLYTKGILDNAIGYSIEVDNKEYVSYINHKGYYEIRLDNNEKNYREKISIIGETEKDTITFTVRYNKEKVATIIYKNKDDKKDITLKVYDGDENGEIHYSYKEYKDEISGEFDYSFTSNDEKVSIKGKYKIESPKELNKLDSKKVETLDRDYDFDSLRKKIDKLKDDDLKELVLEIYESLEKEALDLNYNGMIEETYDEITDNIEDKKTFLLYIGENYYYGFDYNYKYGVPETNKEFDDDDDIYYVPTPPNYNDNYKFLETLIDLQDEYGFHSVAYIEAFNSSIRCTEIDSEYRTKEQRDRCMTVKQYVEDYLKSTEEACTTGYDCLYTKLDTSVRPVAYAIKDGVLVDILTTKSTQEDFENALEKLELKNK